MMNRLTLQRPGIVHRAAPNASVDSLGGNARRAVSVFDVTIDAVKNKRTKRSTITARLQMFRIRYVDAGLRRSDDIDKCCGSQTHGWAGSRLIFIAPQRAMLAVFVFRSESRSLPMSRQPIHTQGIGRYASASQASQAIKNHT